MNPSGKRWRYTLPATGQAGFLKVDRKGFAYCPLCREGKLFRLIRPGAILDAVGGVEFRCPKCGPVEINIDSM